MNAENIRYTYGVEPVAMRWQTLYQFLADHGGQVTHSGADSYYVYPNGLRVLWPRIRSVKTVLVRQFEFENVEAQTIKEGLQEIAGRDVQKGEQ